MNGRTIAMIARLTVVAGLLASSLAMAATTEEKQLASEQKSIDAAARSSAPRADALAREFGVTTETVDGLRAQKRGWGTITIELAMAQELTRRDATNYPDMNTALAKIETMRAGGSGWGRIAQDLGFKLGPVVSAVQRARVEMRREVRAARTERTEKADKPDKAERGSRADRPDRPPRPDKPERPVKP